MSESAIIALAAAFCIAFSTVFPAIAQGKTARAAMEGIARQPEAGGTIRSTMIIAAALVEGVAFFSVVICFLIAVK